MEHPPDLSQDAESASPGSFASADLCLQALFLPPAFLTSLSQTAFVSEIDEAKVKEVRKSESAFLLTWLCFGAVILAEGLFIAASGFLPKELDKFCVNYLYPSFTPTVFVFIAGTIVYGVYKYLQNEKIGGQE